MNRKLAVALTFLTGASAVFAAPAWGESDTACVPMEVVGGAIWLRNECGRDVHYHYCIVNPDTSSKALSAAGTLGGLHACETGGGGFGRISAGGRRALVQSDPLGPSSEFRWFACAMPRLPEDWDWKTNKGYCRTGAQSAAAKRKGQGADPMAPTRVDRRVLQRALKREGFDPGPADGIFGPATRKAIQAWQRSVGQEPTGQLTAKQMRRLSPRHHWGSTSASSQQAAAGGGGRQAGHAEATSASARGPSHSPGERFRDCADCPEMVVVPSGSFRMGSPSSEGGRGDDEGPVHRVTFARAFAVGVYEVTFGEWDACVRGGGCGGHRPGDDRWGRGSRPVINVSWDDAKAYVRWLSRETGEKYRLLSESEWEYVARAGTTTPFHTGRTISSSQANYNGNRIYGSGREGQYREKTTPVGSFSSNAFGLYDVHGNVWEWVEDCWNGSYRGAPSDGSAWTRGDCSRRVLRGGSWSSEPWFLRSASRSGSPSGYRSDGAGFRVARTLTP